MCIKLPREGVFEVGRSGVGDVVESDVAWGGISPRGIQKTTLAIR